MKKNRILIIILILLITGCSKNNPTKIINKEYINNNNGLFFSEEYALAVDQKENNINKYAIYKEKSVDRYVKMFNIEEIKYKKENIIASSKYIYFINDKNIIGYRLDSSIKSIKRNEILLSEVINNFILTKDNIGFKDNYIYISYFIKGSNEIKYLKIREDLKKYEIINKNKIPKNVENFIDK